MDATTDEPRSPRCRSIATPGRRPTPDNLDAEAGILIRLLYEDLVEVEALAVTADEAVTQLPPMPRGRYGKILARLYTLVGKTSGRAQGALERGEETGRAARGPAGGPGPEAPGALTAVVRAPRRSEAFRTAS